MKQDNVHVVENLSVNYVFDASISIVRLKTVPVKKNKNWMLKCFKKWDRKNRDQGKEAKDQDLEIKNFTQKDIKSKKIFQVVRKTLLMIAKSVKT